MLVAIVVPIVLTVLIGKKKLTASDLGETVETEAILVTGGIAYSKPLMAFLKEFVQDMAPVHVYPGEDEMGALALNALNVLRGEFAAQEYR